MTDFPPLFQDIELKTLSPGQQTNSRSFWFLEKPREKERIDTFSITTIGWYIAWKS